MHFSLKDRSRQVLLLLLALSLVRGFLYAAIIPPWQAPDETDHYEHVRVVYEKRRPIISREDVMPEVRVEIAASMVQNHFAERTRPYETVDPWQRARNHLKSSYGKYYHPPLYYTLGALALTLASSADVTVQLYVVRTMSVVLGALVVLLAYATVWVLFPNDGGLPVAVSVFILFLPMHAHISSSVNNDNLSKLMASAAIGLLVLCVRSGLSAVRLVTLGLILTLGLFSDLTFVFIFPVTVIGVLGATVLHPPRLRAWLAAGGLAATVVFGLTIIKGPGVLTSRWWRMSIPRLALGLPRDWPAMWQVLRERWLWYGESMFEGFWARFGWYTTRLNSAWYWLLAGICLAAAGGFVLFIYRRWRRRQLQRWQWIGLGLLALAISLVFTQTVLRFLAGNASWEGDTSLPQGRFLFPAIIPIALFLVLGWRELSPQRYYRQALVVIVAGIVLFDTLILVGHIVPFYYRRVAATSSPAGDWFVYLPLLTRQREAGAGGTSPTTTTTPTQEPSATVVPSSTATPTPEPRSLSEALFGVQILHTDADTLAAARAMGANYARIGVVWGNIEPVQGQRDWSSADNLIRRVTEADLHPIVEAVRNIPPWARKPEYPWSDLECGLMADEQYVAGPSSGFWQFIHDLVERYDGDGVDDMPGLNRPVRLWEAGNEPESSRHDPEQDPPHYGLCYGPIRDPHDRNNLDNADYLPARKYAELLRVFTDAIHTADPDGLSAFGGMMYTVVPAWGLDSFRWLDEVLAVSQPDDFDIMNIHSYLALHCGETMGDRANEVRRQMADHGIDKPVMVTESGMVSWSKQSDVEVNVCGAPATEKRQASYVPQLYTESAAAGLLSTFWFTQKDFSAPSDPSGAGYGLLRRDGTPKPGYWAFKTLTEELAGAEYERVLTAADTGWADVEGYAFRTADVRAKWVLWTPIQLQDVTRAVTFPWARVRVVQTEKYEGTNGTPVAGGVQEVADGDPNDMLPGDGRVTLSLAGSPLYVEDVSQ